MSMADRHPSASLCNQYDNNQPVILGGRVSSPLQIERS